jgi:hypothetical protein
MMLSQSIGVAVFGAFCVACAIYFFVVDVMRGGK